MFPAKDNAELKSILVPRLFVQFATARRFPQHIIVKMHDALHAGAIRHDAINTSPDGPAQMALWLCEYIERTPGVPMEAPLWFANSGGWELVL